MTVSTTTSRVRYEGDGATSVFPVPFKFVDNAHVQVTLRDAASRETPWSEGSQYALSGAGGDSGGSLTVLTEPVDHRPRPGEVLVIALELPFTQDKAFPLGGAFPTTQVEEGLDLAALRDAQLAAFDARAFSVPATDAQVGALELPIDSLRAGRYLGFDAAGKPALLAGTAEAADVSDKTVLPSGAASARSLADLFGLGALTAENVKLHGAKGDLIEKTDGTVTDGSAVLSSGSVSFTEADLGKDITVEGAATTGVTITAVDKAPIDNAAQFDASTGKSVDLTADLNDSDAGDVLPFPASEAAGDLFIIGHRAQFSSVTVDIGTAGVGGAVTWKYWDGSAWTALSGVTDGTAGLTSAAGVHTLTFTKPGNWATRRFNEKDNNVLLYYIAAEVTAVYTTDPVLDQGFIDDGEIRITTSAEHGFQAGQTIIIKGVVGAAAANGTFVIRHARSTQNINRSAFDLIDSTFDGSYVSGGTAHGRLITTIASVSGGSATLAADSGASIAGTTRFRFGTDDTAAIQAAIDTGKTVVVPSGNYAAGPLTVDKPGQKIIGLGGRIVARSTTGTYGVQVSVTADDVSLEDLILDNPDEQTQSVAPRPSGITIQADRVRVAGCTVKSYQDGILVSSSDQSGAGVGNENVGHIIVGNRVTDIVGCSSESRGDGITSWGADAVIVGNYVTAKGWNDGVGMQGDPRIGIHVEGLRTFHSDQETYVYEDSGATITGNAVRGQFRRAIFSENVQQSSICNNTVAGATWWSIGVAGGGEDGRGHSINGNSILYDCPSQNQTEFAAVPAAIQVRSVNSDMRGTTIVGNNVEISGTSRGVYLVGQGSVVREVVIDGNVFKSKDLKDPGMLAALDTFACQDCVISNNVMSGSSGDMMFNFSWARFAITGNIINNVGGADALDFGNRQTVADPFLVLSGNTIIWTGNGDGIEVVNVDNTVIDGNIFKNTNAASGGGAVALFGCDNVIVSNNIMRMANANYIRFFVASVTKVDVNNIKN